MVCHADSERARLGDHLPWDAFLQNGGKQMNQLLQRGLSREPPSFLKKNRTGSPASCLAELESEESVGCTVCPSRIGGLAGTACRRGSGQSTAPEEPSLSP